MLMAKRSTRCHASKLYAARDTLNSTKGGDSDTEVNELTVSPRRSPASEKAVTTATPVGNTPSASRNARSSKLTIEHSRFACAFQDTNYHVAATFNRAAARAISSAASRSAFTQAARRTSLRPDRAS